MDSYGLLFFIVFGYIYILIVVGMLSKFFFIVFLVVDDVFIVLEGFYLLFFIFGLCDIFIMDRGIDFIVKVI